MRIRRRLLRLATSALLGTTFIGAVTGQPAPRLPNSVVPTTHPASPATRPIASTTRPALAAVRPIAAAPGRPTSQAATRPVPVAASPVAVPPVAVPPVAPAPARPGAPLLPDDLPPVPRRAPLATRPAVATNAPWYVAARLRLQAMKAAAAEMNLPAATKDALSQRIGKATWDIDSVSAVGADTGLAAREVERAAEQLNRDIEPILKDQAAAFQAQVTRIIGDVRDLGRLDTSAFDTMVDLLLQPTSPQRAKITEIMAARRRQVEQIGLSPLDGAPMRRQEVGFATRAALREIFTPAQVAEWDSAGKAKAPAVAIAPATRPAGPTDIEAGYHTRLEVMKLTADELAAVGDRGISAPQQLRIKERVEQMRADIARIAAEPVDIRSKQPAEKADALRKDFLTETTNILGERVGRFDDRVDRILASIYTLRSTTLKLDHDWVSSPSNDLQLKPEQEKKIDAILAARLPKLKEIDEKPAPGESSTILRMKKDQIALSVRAEVRAVLTPEQLRKWDAPSLLGR